MGIIRADVHPKLYKACQIGVHKAHEVGHATYLALVFKEAHGMYGYAAGVLLVVIVLGWFFGEEKEGRNKYAVPAIE